MNYPITKSRVKTLLNIISGKVSPFVNKDEEVDYNKLSELYLTQCQEELKELKTSGVDYDYLNKYFKIAVLMGVHNAITKIN